MNKYFIFSFIYSNIYFFIKKKKKKKASVKMRNIWVGNHLLTREWGYSWWRFYILERV